MLVGVVIGRYPAERFSLHRGYVDALCALGATPLLVPAGGNCGESVAAELLERCDALVATGGGDLDPATYAATYEAATAVELMDVDPARDAADLWAVREFHARGRPVLGICRGAQTVAVAMGGTLVPDLPATGVDGHWDEERQYEPIHAVEADVGSGALEALGGATTVNSIHHQAIDEPGPVLRASAWSPDDGVVEAVEAPGLLALQWHPERLLRDDPRHLAPFEWLVKQ
jgi:putative glutamine amidotransferase